MPRRLTVEDLALAAKYDEFTKTARELANSLKYLRTMQNGPVDRYCCRRSVLEGMEALLRELRTTP